MRSAKVIFLTLFCFILTTSCKEKEVVKSPCENGFKDTGEEQVDCGGSCKACVETYLPLLFFTVNQKQVLFDNKSLAKSNGAWTLACTNDSIDFNLELGSNGSVGSYTISPVGNFIRYKGTYYDLVHDGAQTIDKHDQTARRMSGFFDLKFSRGVPNDTIFIESGQYQDMGY